MEAGDFIDGRYEIIRSLGQGAAGQVYLAHQNMLDQPVAIKVLKPENADRLTLNKRFEREAKTASRLIHPGIVRVIDFGRTPDGGLFMVSEYVEGETLADRQKRAPLALGQSIEVVDQILSALAYAHGEGVVHRDVKPANIMVIDRGGELTIKLLDFGLARPTEPAGENATALTREGAVLGTPLYMAPEQGLGGEVDGRADLYAVGVVFYELIAGKLPFFSEQPAEVIRAHIVETPPPIPGADADPRLEALERVVLRAMAKEPSDRFDSAGAFQLALFVPSKQRAPFQTSEGHRSNSKTVWWASAVVGLGLMGMIAFLIARSSQTTDPVTSTQRTSFEDGHIWFDQAMADTSLDKGRPKKLNTAVRIYKAALKRNPTGVTNPEFVRRVRQLEGAHARKLMEVLELPAVSGRALCAHYFETNKRNQKRGAYECLERLQALSQLKDPLAWHIEELGKLRNERCVDRAWIIERLINMPKPWNARVSPLLHKELEHPGAACMRGQIEKRLAAAP